jgi:Na+/melibiose symporter-like transporter
MAQLSGSEGTNPSGKAKTWSVGTLTYTKAGLVVLFAWLLFGDFAIQLKERSDSATAQIVLKTLDASDFLIGLIIGSIPAAIGMIIGPIISVKSDRARTRLGRRIPFMLIPLPVVVLAMLGLALTPQAGAWLDARLGADSPGLPTCSLIAFTFFWCFFEFASAIINAIFGGYINDVVPQAVIGRFFGFFRMVSLGAGIIYNLFIIKHAETEFFWIFLGTGLFYGVGFTLMCWKVREGEYPPPPPLSESVPPGRMQSLRAYVRECFTTPYYLKLFISLIASALAFAPMNSFSVFYARHVGMSLEVYGRYIAASYVISFVLAYFLGSLADRFHPLRLAIVCIGLYAIVSLIGFAFGTTPAAFGMAFLGHTIISGAYFTGTASMGQRLYPKFKFAQFASAAGLLSALCFMLVPPLVGLSIDLSGHQYRLTFLYGGILATAGCVGWLFVHRDFLQLGGPKHYVAPLLGAEDSENIPSP